MKIETCKLYSSDIWIFLPKIIKIDLYNSEQILSYAVSKLVHFFETQCSNGLQTEHLQLWVVPYTCSNSLVVDGYGGW